jgi:hypothetical protein
MSKQKVVRWMWYCTVLNRCDIYSASDANQKRLFTLFRSGASYNVCPWREIIHGSHKVLKFNIKRYSVRRVCYLATVKGGNLFLNALYLGCLSVYLQGQISACDKWTPYSLKFDDMPYFIQLGSLLTTWKFTVLTRQQVPARLNYLHGTPGVSARSLLTTTC